MAALREGPVYDVSVDSSPFVVDGFEVAAVHARPDGLPSAGVVLHPDIGGLRPLFEDMARRLATHGLAVYVIEPFATQPESVRASVEIASVPVFTPVLPVPKPIEWLVVAPASVEKLPAGAVKPAGAVNE